jgi:hypothetical protein
MRDLRTRLILVTLAAMWSPTAWADDPEAAVAENAPRPFYRAELLLYRDGAETRPVRTVGDWAKRRAEILENFQQATGPLPELGRLPPLDVRVREQVDGDGFTRLSIDYVADFDGRVTAHLYLPTGLREGERRAAVLALHPTGAPGKDIISGDAGRPNRQYAAELAARGYVVLAPDYPSFGGLADYDFATDRYVSGTMKALVNHIRGVDLLIGRPEVDARRIGAIGHSLGGHNAIFLAACDERVRAAVTSCGWTPFHDYYHGRIAGWTSERYMPLLNTKYGLDPDRVPFDFYGLCAAVAPRALLSCSPVHDDNFDVRGVRKAEFEIRKVYELHGAGERFAVLYPDCAHDFPPDTRDAAYRFLDEALGQVRNRKR